MARTRTKRHKRTAARIASKYAWAVRRHGIRFDVLPANHPAIVKYGPVASWVPMSERARPHMMITAGLTPSERHRLIIAEIRHIARERSPEALASRRAARMARLAAQREEEALKRRREETFAILDALMRMSDEQFAAAMSAVKEAACA